MVALERLIGRENIQVQVAGRQRAVPVLEMRHVVKSRVVGLELNRPAALVTVQQGHFTLDGGSGDQFRQTGKFLPELAGLVKKGPRTPRLVDQSAVILFLAPER